MAQTLCIKCGSELKVSSYCQLCQQPLIFACSSCEYITEEKVHTDCINAEVLSKPTVVIQEAEITTTTTSKSISNKNQNEANVIRHQEEEIVEAPSYMKRIKIISSIRLWQIQQLGEA
jgi:transcription elongation factor Elf1